MSVQRDERLAALSARADGERRELASAILDARARFDEKRRRWTSFGFWAGALAASATSAYRMMGRNSLSARVNRWSMLGSILVAVARFLVRLFR
ncbi:MAG TPA: hypothetical protein VEG84_11155 [Thermoanaerobaculia bacterium]|nr:hypothetical protein [Thermoanaerobaculia bacterium]